MNPLIESLECRHLTEEKLPEVVGHVTSEWKVDNSSPHHKHYRWEARLFTEQRIDESAPDAVIGEVAKRAYAEMSYLVYGRYTVKLREMMRELSFAKVDQQIVRDMAYMINEMEGRV